MRTLWITDPWETLDHPRDTTLRLVEESARLGLGSWLCDGGALRLEGGSVRARCRRVDGIPRGRGDAGWELGRAEDLAVSSFDVVHYRVDPPVDRRYWGPLQLLRLAEGSGTTRIVNPPHVLALVSEKLGPAQLLGHLPPTLVASAWADLAAFAAAEQRTVLKPLGECGSRNVHLLEWTTLDGIERARGLLREATDGFVRPAVLQRFLPEILTEGEKRLWYVDGVRVGHVRKRPAEGTFLVDMDRGARCEPCALTVAEAALAATIGRALQAANVTLAAVDVIGAYVTDANFTSPGLIPLMEDALGENLAERIVRGLVTTDRRRRAG